MTEQTPQTVVDQSVSATSNVAPTSTATPSASTHIQTQQQLQQQQQNQAFMQQFWSRQITLAEQFESDFKNHPLPLARIKKVMKSDQDVKMISAEAPILFSKACEIFISEITMRAWIHAEENKRRTLQRSDVASAVSRSDQFDFLIDIVPREEVPKSSNRRPKEEPQTEHIFAEQNTLAYYPPQHGMQYQPDPTTASYYQQKKNSNDTNVVQLQAEHIRHEIHLQEQLRIQHQKFQQDQQQSSTSSDTTSQTVVAQQQEQTQTSQQHSSQQSTPYDHKQTSQQIKTSAPPSTTPSDGTVIDALLTAANDVARHQPQESEDQDRQRSKSTRKGSKKTKKQINII